MLTNTIYASNVYDSIKILEKENNNSESIEINNFLIN